MDRVGEKIRCQRDAILALAREHGAREIRLFGSAARGDDRPGSDADFLVRMEPGRTLLDLIGLSQDLEDMLGLPVDVVTEEELSPHAAAEILAEAAAL